MTEKTIPALHPNVAVDLAEVFYGRGFALIHGPDPFSIGQVAGKRRKKRRLHARAFRFFAWRLWRLS